MNSIKERPQSIFELGDIALESYRKNPMKYIDGVLLSKLNIKLEPRQRKVLETIFKNREVLIPSHFAFGKSFICALLILTLENLYPNGFICSVFAPTYPQIKDIIWREMKKVWNRVNANEKTLAGEMLEDEYKIGAGALARGIAPKQSAKGGELLQNVQGKHDNVVLIIVDEAGGVSKQVFEQISFLKSAGKLIYIVMIGNPINMAGDFGQLCTTDMGDEYTILHFTAYESPNMIANGLTSLQAIRQEADKVRALPQDERKEYYQDKHYNKPYPTLLSPGFVINRFLKWGESSLFLSTCIGEWAQTSEDVLITLARANEITRGSYINAQGEKLWYAEINGEAKWNGIKKITISVDCSGEGKDKYVLYALEGNREIHYKKFVKTYEKNDVDFKGTKLKEDGPYIAKYIVDNIIKKYPDRAIAIGIDRSGGYGDAIYSSLMSYPFDPKFITIIGVNFAAKQKDEIRHHDLPTEMASILAERANSQEGLLLEPNDDLKNQITSRKMKEDEKHRNKIESKKDYKDRGHESPDDMDSLMINTYIEGLNINYDKLANSFRKSIQRQSAYIQNQRNKRIY
jgi:hypothetical protein